MTTEDTQVPHVEQPDEVDKPEETGRYCFIDASRPCSAECMSFLVARPIGPDYVGEQWAKCSLLVNLHKMGKHAVALATQGDSLLKHLRVKRADEIRDSQPLPPKVR
jgi:hypothetical protein